MSWYVPAGQFAHVGVVVVVHDPVKYLPVPQVVVQVLQNICELLVS